MAIIGVVKYNGTPDVFAWKFPNEELGTWTQLIVNESQEAVLFKSGMALDQFGSGRHTLETANIPLLNRIVNIPFGSKSPFTAEVWYVNKVFSLDIKWGTQTPVQLQDPKFGVFVPVSSYGQFGIRIEDSRKFLIKLVGTLPAFDRKTVSRYFSGLYQTKVKDAISSYLVNEKIGILEINASIDRLSEYLKVKMAPTLAEYGIGLVNFFVNGISVPEDDPGVVKLKEALAKRAEMEIIGYSYQQQRSFDTLEGAAKNPGTGASGLMGAGIGLGIGAGIGGAFGSQFGGIMNEVNVAAPARYKACPACGSKMDAGKRFCADCGYDTARAAKAGKDEEGRTGASGEGDKAEMQLNSQTAGPVAKEPLKCAACGTIVTLNAKFCPECGAKLA